MKETNRNGVTIDTCTVCRGVWLDRGELEKLVAAFEHERPVSLSDHRNRQRRGSEEYDREWGRGLDDDDDEQFRGRRHSKMSRLMDFFD